MFLLKEKIDNINSYSFSDKFLIKFFKNGLLYINDSEFILERKKILGGYIDKENILNIITENDVFWYHNGYFFLKTRHLSGFTSIKIKNNVRLFRNNDLNYCFYDLDKKEVVEVFNAKFDGLYPSEYHNGCLIIHKFPEPVIQSLSLSTGIFEWQQELSIKRITKIISCYEDVLSVVYEKENGETGVLGIDAQTGKILWNTEGGNFWSRSGKDNTTIVHFYSNHFSFYGDNLNKFCNIFREVNAQTGEIIREGILEYLDGLELRVIAFEIQGSSICFTAQRHFFGATVLGVMDYDTLEVIWWEEIVTPDEKGNNCFIMNNPQMGDNKLYALDSQSTLHIFERTSDEPYKSLQTDWLIPF